MVHGTWTARIGTNGYDVERTCLYRRVADGYLSLIVMIGQVRSGHSFKISLSFCLQTSFRTYLPVPVVLILAIIFMKLLSSHSIHIYYVVPSLFHLY